MFGIFKKFKKEKDQELQNDSLSQIKSCMDLLFQKSSGLTDAYAEQKEKLTSINETLKSFTVENNPTALKFEHNILEKITVTDFSCEQAIVGRDGTEFKKNVDMLAHAVRQRQHFETEE